MLQNLFINIKTNPKDFLAARNGDEFERLIKDNLYKLGFNDIGVDAFKEIVTEEKFKKIKKFIIDKNREDYLTNDICNDVLINKFLFQPYGSQNYPDFLIITQKHFIPIEIKYSKKSNDPMWNSNMPKGNGFYIFGSFGKQDVTFFMGSDVLDSATRKAINDFFEYDAKNLQNKFLSKSMPILQAKGKNVFGFKPYIRKAYETSKAFSTMDDSSVFNRFDRDDDENRLIDQISQL